MKTQMCRKLNAFFNETDEWNKGIIADSLKDLLEDSADWVGSEASKVKPAVKSAIDTYAYNPSVANQLSLLSLLATIGL